MRPRRSSTRTARATRTRRQTSLCGRLSSGLRCTRAWLANKLLRVASSSSGCRKSMSESPRGCTRCMAMQAASVGAWRRCPLAGESPLDSRASPPHLGHQILHVVRGPSRCSRRAANLLRHFQRAVRRRAGASAPRYRPVLAMLRPRERPRQVNPMRRRKRRGHRGRRGRRRQSRRGHRRRKRRGRQSRRDGGEPALRRRWLHQTAQQRIRISTLATTRSSSTTTGCHLCLRRRRCDPSAVA